EPGAFGPPESGAISLRDESTREIPQVGRLAAVDVTFDAESGAFTIEIENLSASVGAMHTELSGAVWAVHDEGTSLFVPGTAASTVTGLESLAEDGDPTDWEADLSGSVDDSGTTSPAAV